jgi:hypothetical protein
VLRWTADDAFSIGDVEYVCRPVTGRFPSTPERFCLLKARWQVEWYEELLRRVQPQRIVEVGMYDGGSLAFAAEVAEPRLLVGIDRRSTPSAPLLDVITRRGWQTSVRPHYDVDQSDAARVTGLVDDAMGDEPLDLVIDDASHLLEPSRSTFNTLFPRLRPGAPYVLEDWPMHMAIDTPRPLTLMVFELVLACSDAPGVVAGLTVDRNYVVVTRGSAPLTVRPFDLFQRCGPRGRALMDAFAVSTPVDDR